MRTVTVGTEIVAIGQYQTNFGALMVLTVVSVIPVLVMCVFAQRRLVEGWKGQDRPCLLLLHPTD